MVPWILLVLVLVLVRDVLMGVGAIKLVVSVIVVLGDHNLSDPTTTTDDDDDDDEPELLSFIEDEDEDDRRDFSKA